MKRNVGTDDEFRVSGGSEYQKPGEGDEFPISGGRELIIESWINDRESSSPSDDRTYGKNE